MQEIIKADFFENFISLIEDQETYRWVFCIQENVYKIYQKQFQKLFASFPYRMDFLLIEDGEPCKTRTYKASIEDKLFEKGIGKDSCLIAIGGGTVLDLIGFVAGTYMRGIPFISVPTTLLSMVDASIGGKVGINTSFGKNLIGLFYFPQKTIVDIQFFKTLPEKERRCGVMEMVKHALLSSILEFEQLEKLDRIDEMSFDMIFKSMEFKQKVVLKDTYEKGIRELLNFGHTLGHSLEKAYSLKLTHGEAVGIGMIIEGIIAYQKAVLPYEDLQRICDLIGWFLPLFPLDFERLKSFLKLDKKNKNEHVHIVLLEKIGKPIVNGSCFSHPVTYDEIENAILEFNKRLG